MSSQLETDLARIQSQSPSPGSQTLEELGLKGLLVLIIGCLGFGLLLFADVYIIPGYNEVLDGFVAWARVLKAFTAFFLALLFNDRIRIPFPLFMTALVTQVVLWILYFLVPGGAIFPLSHLQIFSGFTFVVFALRFIQFISNYPPHVSCFAILTSALLSHLFAFLPATLPLISEPLLHAILMLMALLFLCICMGHRSDVEKEAGLARQEQLETDKDELRFAIFPLKKTFNDLDRLETMRSALCVGTSVIIFPFFYGIFLELSFIKDINSALSDQISQLIAIALLLTLLVVIAFINRTYPLVKLFVVILPFFTMLLLISPFFWQNTPVSSSVFIRALFAVNNIALWIYLARITFVKPEKRLLYFSLSLGLLWLSLLLGQITGSNLFINFAIDFGAIAGIALTAVWILAMTCILLLLLLIKSNSLLLEKSLSSDIPSLFDRILSFSESCGLSPRETEILIEFAHGRSAAYIGNTFFISEHTVKTHLRRIYTKAKVHNRQELLNLINASD